MSQSRAERFPAAGFQAAFYRQLWYANEAEFSVMAGLFRSSTPSRAEGL
jgi:hypothetical protein